MPLFLGLFCAFHSHIHSSQFSFINYDSYQFNAIESNFQTNAFSTLLFLSICISFIVDRIFQLILSDFHSFSEKFIVSIERLINDSKRSMAMTTIVAHPTNAIEFRNNVLFESDSFPSFLYNFFSFRKLHLSKWYSFLVEIPWKKISSNFFEIFKKFLSKIQEIRQFFFNSIHFLQYFFFDQYSIVCFRFFDEKPNRSMLISIFVSCVKIIDWNHSPSSLDLSWRK